MDIDFAYSQPLGTAYLRVLTFHEGGDIMDILYFGITAGLFLLTGLFIRLLDKV